MSGAWPEPQCDAGERGQRVLTPCAKGRSTTGAPACRGDLARPVFRIEAAAAARVALERPAYRCEERRWLGRPFERGMFGSDPGAWLQPDDATHVWQPTRCQTAQQFTAVQREARCERGSPDRQRAAVRRGVRDQKQDAINIAVTTLASDPTIERLDVAQPRLGLDRQRPHAVGDHRVPRSRVAWNGDRHFRPPEQARTDPNAKAGEETHLRGVTDRIAAGECAYRQIQPDSHAHPTQNAEACSSLLTAFDPTDRGVGDARGQGHGRLTQPSRSASLSNLVPEREKSTSREPIRSVDRTFATGHRRSASPSPLTCHLTASSGRVAA